MKLTLNVPRGERLVRALVGLAALVGGVLWAVAGQALWGGLIAVSGAGLAATGVVGWCPLCAAVGRTLPEVAHQVKVGKLWPWPPTDTNSS